MEVICGLCLKYQEGLLEDGDGSQVMCNHCDYEDIDKKDEVTPAVNMGRREKIEYLCKRFLTRECTAGFTTYHLYDYIMESLLNDPYYNIGSDVGGNIEKIGDLLFNSKPGTLLYVFTFLEFVCGAYVMPYCDDVPTDTIVTAAANVIERTNFEFEADKIPSSAYSKFFDILVNGSR